MKLEIIRDKLLQAVTAAERIAGKHLSLPVLSCVVLEAAKDSLVVRATNLDVGVEFTIPAKVTEPGVAAVSGAILKSFLINSPNDKNVRLSKTDGSLEIKIDQSQARIKTHPAEEFPVIPKVTEGKEFSIYSSDFVYGIESVYYSAAVSLIKPELSSVYIYPENDHLVFVATDSFRLAEKKIKTKKASGIDHLLIPFRNVAEIARLLSGLNAEIKISSSKNQLSISAPGMHITSRVIDGVFPDYQQIIPKEFLTKAVVIKQDLLQALKLTSSFSDPFNQAVFDIDISKKSFDLKTKNNDIGEGAQNIKGAFTGKDVTITFNLKYILDCLQSIEGESVVMELVGAGKPMVIRDSSNPSFTYLVMPMNK